LCNEEPQPKLFFQGGTFSGLKGFLSPPSLSHSCKKQKIIPGMYWKAFFICGEILGSIKAKRNMSQHDDAMMDQEQ